MKNTSIAQLLSLSRKTAIVTGGAVGIGYGIAYRLAEAGANIVICDIDTEASQSAVAQLTDKGWNAIAVTADVSRSEDVENLLHVAKNSYGDIDILVNNAGIYPNIPIAQMKPEDFDRVIATNLRSVYLCTRIITEAMIRQGHGGKIINISSIDAIHPSGIGLAHYDATKHGVWGFTKNAALEFAPHNIWINAIAPGAIETPGIAKSANDEILKAITSRIPMNRIGDPDDIGRAALFLASDLSSYMTGEQIVVDGGFLLT
jgi:2-dehydro-3-deoxy-D-gluconate 5-dehydrogenase